MFLGIQELIDGVSNVVENALGSSLSDVLLQIAATIILFLVVRFFFWNKITDFLDKRRQLMDSEMEDAKQANLKAKLLEEKKQKEYQDLKDMSKDYIEKAKTRGESEREIIVTKAKDEADKILLNAEQEIELEKQKAQADIQTETVELATLMASKILEKEIDEKKYQNLSVKKLEGSE